MQVCCYERQRPPEIEFTEGYEGSTRKVSKVNKRPKDDYSKGGPTW